MSLKLKKRFLVYSSAIASSFCICYSTHAQSLPITVNGSDNTRLRRDGNKVFVEGGAIEGTNQFNSFREFSIPEGIELEFMNGLDISDIFVRVTGVNISNLDGILSAGGNANFWLLNPNGIIIGENFQLNIGGSFFATTGESILFADDVEFSAKNTQATLTQSAPIGVNFPGGKKPEAVIIVRGEGHDYNTLKFLSGKLASEPSQTTKNTLEASINEDITLIGRKVDFNGARILTKGGDIRAAAVEQGQILFNPNNSFNIDRIKTFGNISLSDASIIKTTSSPNNQIAPGAIEFLGRNISLNDISIFLSQNPSNIPAQNIKITTTENFLVAGEVRLSNPFARAGIHTEIDAEGGRGAGVEIYSPKTELISANIYTSSISKGDAGDIKFKGETLTMANVSAINSIIRDSSNSGEIKLNISKKIQLSEPAEKDTTSDITTNIGVINYGFGKSKKVTINSDTIEVLNGAKIFNRTIALGRVDANNRAEFTGKGDNLEINTRILLVSGARAYEESSLIDKIENASFVGTYNLNKINIGDLILNAEKLIVEKKGVVGSFSFSEGNTGNAIINASKSISLNDGRIIVSVEIPSERYEQEFGDLLQTGRSQQLNISTPSISTVNNSEITVSNNGIEAAGTANINADRIQLENSKITATTSAGSGQLNLNSKDFRIFNSQITTAAAGAGTGGDININSDIFLANSSSQITATAVQGNGGNISLRGNDGIFISADSVVSADSEFGVDGMVNIEGITQDQIGNELSFYNIRKAEESQQQPPTTFTSDCVEESLTANTGVNPKYDPYRDPDSPLSGLTPPEQNQETDKELLKHYATGIIMANVPKDESLLLDYLREHFEDVRISPSGVIQTGEIKNLEKIEIPADWLKRSFNYLEICQ